MRGELECLGIVLDQGKRMNLHQVTGNQDDIFTIEQYGARNFAGGHDGAVDPGDRYGCNGRGWERPHTMVQVTLLWNNSGMTQRNI